MKPTKQSTYEVITAKLIESLNAGTVPWRKPWTGGAGGKPKNAISKKDYRGINYFMLAMAPHSSPYFLTFKQAQQLGGTVRKGEKGLPVTYFTMLAGKDKASGKEKNIPLLKYYTVFNLEQCDGIDAAKLEALTTVPSFEHDPIESAEKLLAEMKGRTCEVKESLSDRAYYSPSLDFIQVPMRSQFKSLPEFYCTTFHELGHSTGHKSRLNRLNLLENHYFGSPEYSKEELVAEMASAFLCGHAGIDGSTLDNSAAYINSWIKVLKGNSKLALEAASAAQKAADYLLGVKPDYATITE